MNETKATLFATVMTLIYTLLGLVSIFYMVDDWLVSLPIVVFYFLILVSTHLSVSFFLSIIPEHSYIQKVINGALLVIYFILAFNLNHPLNFMIVTALLFSVSTIKYLLMVEENPHKKLLWRKVSVQTLGTIACILTILGILSGYALISTSLWLFCFIIANIYIISIKPLYRISNED
ncbi:MAG: hypothetical protein G01um101420_286 [Parcubacteria group bacterium Gr01-1014_20]|nr:MAG: hypothetical protein G01um101420_286 [Parcubacteria group bacterium Gr01-1014_20]